MPRDKENNHHPVLSVCVFYSEIKEDFPYEMSTVSDSETAIMV